MGKMVFLRLTFFIISKTKWARFWLLFLPKKALMRKHAFLLQELLILYSESNYQICSFLFCSLNSG